jgi:chemotaxis protein MotB
MSKKKAPEAEGNSERWLLSYSDFMTLLMTMFVILYSMGQVDVKKYKQMADSFKSAFSVGGGPVKVVDAQINQSSGTDANGQPNPIEIPGIPQKAPDSVEVAGQLTSFLSSQNLGKEVSVQTNIEGVLISLSEELIFPPGTATLQANAYPVLDTIITMLKKIENPVRVVGHTDNTPPVDPKYKSNWDLSLARGMVIGDYLIKNGIKPDRLTVSGRGEYDPIFPNDTPEHKALNSRADIVIIYQVDSNVTGLDSNHLTTPSTSQPAQSGGTQ